MADGRAPATAAVYRDAHLLLELILRQSHGGNARGSPSTGPTAQEGLGARAASEGAAQHRLTGHRGELNAGKTDPWRNAAWRWTIKCHTQRRSQCCPPARAACCQGASSRPLRPFSRHLHIGQWCVDARGGHAVCRNGEPRSGCGPQQGPPHHQGRQPRTQYGAAAWR